MPRGSILSTLRLRHIGLRAHFRSHPEYYAKEYLSRNQKPIIIDGGGKYLSRGNKTISIRGEPPKRIVLLAFENLDKTQAAFNSAAYAKALMYGEKYAKFRIYAVEGLDPTATE